MSGDGCLGSDSAARGGVVLCARCGYDLAGQGKGVWGVVRCPECGWEVVEGEVRLAPWPRWWVVARWLCMPCVLNIVVVGMLAAVCAVAAESLVGRLAWGLMMLAVLGLVVAGVFCPMVVAAEVEERHAPAVRRPWVFLKLVVVGIAANVVLVWVGSAVGAGVLVAFGALE